MHWGFYDAKILTTLVVNSHNVLGSSRTKGDLSLIANLRRLELSARARALRHESLNICYLNIEEELADGKTADPKWCLSVG